MSGAASGRSLDIDLRVATPEDCDRVLAWANDPATRAASFRSAPIARADHERWFASSLENPGRSLFIAELEGEPVAVVRFDHSGPGSAELSLNIAPARRGQRLSVPVLLAAGRRARALGLARLVARIRPANEASLRSFGGAGFRLTGREELAGQDALRYELLLGDD